MLLQVFVAYLPKRGSNPIYCCKYLMVIVDATTNTSCFGLLDLLYGLYGVTGWKIRGDCVVTW